VRKYNENIFYLFVWENMGIRENWGILYTLKRNEEKKMFISDQYAAVWNLDGNFWDAMLDVAGDMYWVAMHLDAAVYRDVDKMILSL
jgi:hypothetical protein